MTRHPVTDRASLRSRPRAALTRVSLALLLCLFGAACGNVKSSNVPGGGHAITCGNGMKDCVGRAGKLCGDDGYTIIEGVSRPKLLGGSSSSYRSMAEVAELSIVCGVEEYDQAEEGSLTLPERTDPPLEEPGAEPVAPAGALVCTPGATQQCVGPGACAGGQVCLGDGRGFGACDCGGTQATPAPAPPVAAPPAAAPKQPAPVPGQMPAAEPLSK